MDDQVTPQQFIVFLFALGIGVSLAFVYWYWAFGTGPVAWVLVCMRSVNRFALWAIFVMSRQEQQTSRQTKQTAQTDADPWTDRIQVDRTKTALIELLVYSGWGVGEIRGVLKGDTGALGIEIEAVRVRLGLDAPAPHVTPIVGRRTSAQFQDDPDLEYQHLV